MKTFLVLNSIGQRLGHIVAKNKIEALHKFMGISLDFKPVNHEAFVNYTKAVMNHLVINKSDLNLFKDEVHNIR